MSQVQKNQLRQIPSVHELLHHEQVQELEHLEDVSQEMLTLCCQESVQHIREQILEGNMENNADIKTTILQTLQEQVHSLTRSPLKPLINGTGVVLHTNLGRAKLSKAAREELISVASHYSNLEFNLEPGTRGSRHALVEDLLCRLTGAEAALVCNNNAAAVFLTLKELAQNQEVLVSRGELVEIGGSFRVFEIMQESGAHLVEVGTTNKTHLYDYERAIGEQTGLILKVHTSNFVIKGFTASVPGRDLVHLAHAHALPVFEDLGSGVLLDLRPYGIGDEPTVQEVLQEGVDVVSFSGDKLLGGPQAGIVAGKKKYIDRLKKNQFMRSLRVDKFTLAALHATLRAYLDPAKAMREIPTLQMILQSEEEIKHRAETFINELDSAAYTCQLVRMESEVGGGTLPDVRLPSWGVAIQSHTDRSLATFSRRLRLSAYPVIGRVHQDQFLLDFRTITAEEIPLLLAQIKKQDNHP